MSKYKITVYAICKNEKNNVKDWYNSMKEADEIIVLDTGSEDGTYELLKKFPKIKAFRKKITPWRFDTARNVSLSYVSKDTDICVCTDLDERFDSGWRQVLEQNWTNETTRGKYLYNWSFKNGKPATTFYLNKIHTLHNYHWVNAVHEVLETTTTENEKLIEGIILNHYQDFTKSRSSYLTLLETSVAENPNNDRNMHYLGREYMYYKKWNDAIETLHNHLTLKTATWKDERCASMRYIGYCYFNKKYIEEAIMWYEKSIEEAPYLREPYFDLGYLYYSIKDYINSEKYLKKALKIKNKSYTYINEEKAWNDTIYDLLSISCFYNKKYKQALSYIKKAINMNPECERLKSNLETIKNYAI